MPKYNPLIFSGLDFTGGGGPAGAPQWKAPVDTEADLPMVANNAGDVRAVKDNQKLFVWDAVNSVWVDTTLTLAVFGSTPNVDGASLAETPETVGSVDIYRRSFNIEPADENNPGAVSTSAQSFSGDKTFKDDIIAEAAVDAQGGVASSLGTLDLGTTTATVNLGSPGALVAIHGPAEIDYTPAVSGDWVVPPSLVIPALDELAQRTKDIEDGIIAHDQLVKEPTGFPNRTDSLISFDDESRTFTIQPSDTSFDVYIHGEKFTKTIADSLQIPNLPGDHYIYYDNNGNLGSTQIFSSAIIQDYAFISIVYWNTETASHTYFAEERHGVVMDGATHSYLHTVFGSRFISGLALEGFSVDGTGNSAANAQFTSDSGSIRDEDILHQILSATEIPILFRYGQQWRKKTKDSYPVIYNGTAGYTSDDGRLPYNQYIAGTWHLTEIQDAKFVLVHFFGTNDIDNPFVGVQGITQYNSVSDARIGANSEISSLSGLPFAEFVPVGSVIFQSRTTYSNVPKARVLSTDTGAEYVDFRGSQLYTPAGTATTHGLLSGLAGDDHLQYLLADGTRAVSGDLPFQDESGVLFYEASPGTDYIKIKAPASAVSSYTLTLPAAVPAISGSAIVSDSSGTLSYTYITAGSVGDIPKTNFTAIDGASNQDITGFVFSGLISQFEAQVSVTRATGYAAYSIRGVNTGSSWQIMEDYLGDDVGILFTITSAGQMRYTLSSSGNNATVTYRALTI